MAQSARSTAGIRSTLTALLCLASGFALGLLGGSCAAPTDPAQTVWRQQRLAIWRFWFAIPNSGRLRELASSWGCRCGQRCDRSSSAASPGEWSRGWSGEEGRILDASVVGELSEGARLRVFATMVATAPPQWFKAESGDARGPSVARTPRDAFQNQKGIWSAE